MWAAQAAPCILCGQPINYALPYSDKMAVTEEHILPWSTHPDLRDEPSNLGPAHSLCNKRKNDGPASLSLGMTSEEW